MPKPVSHYLVKSEPSVYSWAQLCRDGRTRWEGVRNFEARNNLRAMKLGDRLLFYHSNEGKEIVGVAEVVTTAYADPTAPGQDWSAVDVAPLLPLAKPVSLATIKADSRFAEFALIRKSRISVVPVAAAEFDLLLKLGGTKLPVGKAQGAAAKAKRTARTAATPAKARAKKG